MKRADLIKEIAAEFELIVNRLSETEVATVASVVELEPQHLAEIAKRVQKLTGAKNVKLKTVIDKSLLARIIIRYGNSELCSSKPEFARAKPAIGFSYKYGKIELRKFL
ncbi:hypothetical protein SASPL_136135 [Salvia splendens]|uniref:F-type H+-transporting ATPase subunit delta n=1 Tax=Salvia splendens TaxID=180675 RepID=A0A8X8ZGC9_SALSN|nr:hypothetical protein SASPL_136135 [Salvia splendens]